MADFTCLSRFRLAACLLIALSHCDWEADLEKTLNDLPNDLFGIYNRFLEPVSSEHWVYIEAIFRWLVFSVAPITPDELADAVAFDFSDPEKYVYRPDRREGNARAIPKWLEGLVVVKHDMWGKPWVALAHASVQDYVLSKQFMAKFCRDLNAGLSHAFIARTCIHYLIHFADHPLYPGTFPNYPMSIYAAKYWFYHLQHCHDRTALSTSTVLLLEGGGRQYAALNCLHDFYQPFRYSPDWLRPIPLPLYMCSHIGYTEGVQWLLDNGADPNTWDGIYGRNVLQAASEEGHTEIVSLLIENGAHVNVAGQADTPYGTALEAASRRGHLETICLLLEKGADFGRALAFAAGGGDAKTVRVLLEKRSNNESGNFGGALQAASQAAHMEIIHLLLENGANINELERDYTALWVASEEGHVDLVRLLLSKGANVNLGGEYGSPLQIASRNGHAEIVHLLLENGANVDATAKFMGSALYAASEFWNPYAYGYTDIVRLLLEKGAAINVGGGPHGTALRIACMQGSTELVRLLLQNGADASATGGTNSTPLSVAAHMGHLTIVEILIEKGANVDVNAVGGENATALQLASSAGHTEIAYLLLEKGADVNAGGRENATALQLASNAGHTEIVQILLEHGADVNAAGGKYGTSLQAACARRLDPNWVYPTGYAEYFLACSADIVRFLLEKGADVNAAGGGNGNALQMASQNGYTEIAQILRDHGARPEEGVEVQDTGT
jgi:ankyrin repeat protein